MDIIKNTTKRNCFGPKTKVNKTFKILSWWFCQMIYYVDDLKSTIEFYHGLLKNNGRLMIIVEARK